MRTKVNKYIHNKIYMDTEEIENYRQIFFS